MLYLTVMILQPGVVNYPGGVLAGVVSSIIARQTVCLAVYAFQMCRLLSGMSLNMQRATRRHAGGTKLASKPADIKDWDTLSPHEKKLYTRQMACLAAFASHTDHELGRLVDASTTWKRWTMPVPPLPVSLPPS
jgi:hypothetical protein